LLASPQRASHKNTCVSSRRRLNSLKGTENVQAASVGGLFYFKPSGDLPMALSGHADPGDGCPLSQLDGAMTAFDTQQTVRAKRVGTINRRFCDAHHNIKSPTRVFSQASKQ
jgi:hypothetical protein